MSGEAVTNYGQYFDSRIGSGGSIIDTAGAAGSQVLTYNGAKFTPQTPAAGGVTADKIFRWSIYRPNSWYVFPPQFSVDLSSATLCVTFDRPLFVPFYSDWTGVVTTAGVYVSTGGAGDFRVAIYEAGTSEGLLPVTKLGEALIDTPSTAAATAALDAPVALTQGQLYWLCMAADAASPPSLGQISGTSHQMVQLGDTTGPNAGLSVPNVYWANASARVTGTAFPATNPLATYAYAPAYGSITSNCNISQVWFRTESGA